MTLNAALRGVLLLLGVGFLVANLRVALDFARFLRRRSASLIVWRPPRPPSYGLQIGIGFALGVLVVVNLAIGRLSPAEMFGEGMMFLYYAAAVPLGRRILRGFYTDGVWADSGFVRYEKIDGISWREGEQVTLLLISHLKNLARRLVVPGTHYGAARRLLRDKIKAQDIRFHGIRLDLGDHDDRGTV
jgi:hypothetical protein